jgi:polysaccharide pyruvyl transferase WcaK-like protein
MKRARVGLVGYYGYGNYGDELFSLVFRKVFHDCELIPLQDNTVRPFYGENIEEKVDSVDCILIGGGDLIIGNYWSDQYFEEAFLAKPVYIHGVGVPTWSGEKPEVVERLAAFFQHPSVRHIGVRDRESAVWIEQKLKPVVPVQVSCDMICSLDLPKVSKPSGSRVFGLITRRQAPGEIQWHNVANLCNKAVELGYEIKTIVLGTGPERQSDLEGLSEEFPYEDMRIYESDDLWDLTREIGSCDVIASMKFHGCVVSMMYGIPAIGMITTDKFRNLFNYIERPDLIAHHTHEDLPDRLGHFMASIPHLTRSHLREQAVQGLVRLRHALLGELD